MKYAPYPYLLRALDQHYGGSRSGTGTPLRILLTTFWKYPQPGGLSKYIETLKSGLEQLGHQVDVADYRGNRNFDRKMRDAVVDFLGKRYGEANKRVVDSIRKLSAYEINLRHTVNLTHYDIIHAQDRYTANVLGKLNRYYHIPLFYTPHQLGVYRSLLLQDIVPGSVEEAYFRAIDQTAIRYADKIITICHVFDEPLMRLGASPQQLHTIYTGVNLDVPPRSSEKDDLVISSVSRMTPRKGHRYLLEALDLIREHLGHVRVLIVGDGDVKRDLEKLANDLNLPNVEFTGYRVDIAQILSGSDIYVHPTTSDMLPISVIEAMFAGQAIITTRINGLVEIIKDGETGLIVDPGNASQIAEKLTWLISHEEERQAMGKRARLYAQQYLRADDMVAKIAELYHVYT